MTIDKDIRIIDLLAQREAEFMKVHALEEAVCSLLGGAAFPFPPVQADLPSRHPRRMKAAAAVPEQAGDGGAVPGLRRLRTPEENCYHILYIDENGQHQESFQNDYGLLEEILQLQSDEFQVTGIETVFFESMDKWHQVDCIFENAGGAE